MSYPKKNLLLKAVQRNAEEVKLLQRPSPLKSGDTVTVISPAGRPDPEGVRRAIDVLRREGFCVVQYKGERGKTIPAFAASDEFRARELAWALSEPGIRAVFCARAGYGSVRTIHHLKSNAGLLRRLQQATPRMILGYSDCTYIHQWIQNELGWISFHGPVVGFLGHSDLRSLIKSVQRLPQKGEPLKLGKLQIIQRGYVGRARLIGGNLSLLSLAGSARLPREPGILCLEDINEDFYRLDRMIWNLIDGGYSPFVKGIVLGTFKDCGVRDRKKFPWSTVVESLKILCRGPIVQAQTFGHGLSRQVILPLGVEASLSSQRGLKLLRGCHL